MDTGTRTYQVNGFVLRMNPDVLDRMSEVLRNGCWELFCLTGGELQSLIEAGGFNTLEQILRLSVDSRPAATMAT